MIDEDEKTWQQHKFRKKMKKHQIRYLFQPNNAINLQKKIITKIIKISFYFEFYNLKIVF